MESKKKQKNNPEAAGIAKLGAEDLLRATQEIKINLGFYQPPSLQHARRRARCRARYALELKHRPGGYHHKDDVSLKKTNNLDQPLQ